MTAPTIPNQNSPLGIVLIDPATGLPYNAAGGVGLSAGTQSVNSGTVVFSNSNGVSFGLSGSVLTAQAAATATAGLNGILAGTQTASSGSVSFINSNGVTFGMSNSSQITASVAAQSSLSFSNANGVSFGTAGSTLTASVAAQTSLAFSNANGISFGTNAGTLTASYNSTQFAGTGTTFAGTNASASVTLNSAGLNMALSAAAAGAGGVDVQISGNTSGTTAPVSTGTLSLAGGNNITLSQSGNAITIVGGTGTAAQSNQTLGVYGVSQTTGQSSSSTYDARSLSFAGYGVVSVGQSGGTIQISAPGTTSIGQMSAGISGGNTSGNTGTVAQGLMVFAGGSNVTLSGSTSGSSISVTISAAAGGAGGVNFGVSTGGNTAGSTGTVSTGNAVLVGSGPISLSQSSGTAGATVTINAPATSSIAGTNGISVSVNGSTISVSQLSPAIYASSNTLGTTSSAYPPPNLTIVGAGNVSVGWSSNGLVVSGATVAGQPVNFSAGTTSGNLGSVVFSNSNGVSFGLNGSTITASAAAGAAFSGGVSGGNTAGTTGISGTALALAGGNNITLSQATGTGGASITVSAPNIATTAGYYFGGNTTGQSSSSTAADQTISISAAGIISAGWSNSSIVLSAAQSNQSIGLYGVGNTTQSSSGTADARSLSFDGLGGMTVGVSANSVQLSAPAVSSLVGTNGISLSSNGSTITISGNFGTMSYWDNGIINGSASVTQNGVGSVVLQPVRLEGNFTFSAMRQFISGSFSTSSNSSYANTLSFQAGIYTLTGSTLSLLTSGSQSYAFTNTSNNSTGSLSGIRGITVPLAVSGSQGNYWLGVWSSTASANANWATISNVVQYEGALTYSGAFGAATAASNQVVLGGGIWSTTSTALPGSIALSNITGSVGNIAPFVNLYNVTA